MEEVGQIGPQCIEVDAPLVHVYDQHDEWRAGGVGIPIEEHFIAGNMVAVTIQGAKPKSSGVRFDRYTTLAGCPEADNVYLHICVLSLEQYKDSKAATVDIKAWMENCVWKHQKATDQKSRSQNFIILLVHRLLVGGVEIVPPTPSANGEEKKRGWFDKLSSSKTAAEKHQMALEEAEKKMQLFERDFAREFSGRAIRYHHTEVLGLIEDVLHAAYIEKDQLLKYRRHLLLTARAAPDWSIAEYWSLSQTIAINYMRFGGLFEAMSAYGDMFATWWQDLDKFPFADSEHQLLKLCSLPNMFGTKREASNSRWQQSIFTWGSNVECLVYIVGCEMLISLWLGNKEAALQRFTCFIQSCADKLAASSKTISPTVKSYFLYKACEAAYDFCEITAPLPASNDEDWVDAWDACGTSPGKAMRSTAPPGGDGTTTMAVSNTSRPASAQHPKAGKSIGEVLMTNSVTDGYTISIGDLCVLTRQHFTEMSSHFGHHFNPSTPSTADPPQQQKQKFTLPELEKRETFLEKYLELSKLAADCYNIAGRRRSENVLLCDCAKVLLQTNRTEAAALVEERILPHFDKSDWFQLSLNARKLYISCLEEDQGASRPFIYVTNCVRIITASNDMRDREVYWRKALGCVEHYGASLEVGFTPMFTNFRHYFSVDGKKCYPPHLCVANIDHSTEFVIAVKCPIDVSQDVSVEVDLESKKNWSNVAEELRHEVTLTESTASYVEKDSLLIVTIPFSPCHAGDYKAKSIRLHFGKFLCFEKLPPTIENNNGPSPMPSPRLTGLSRASSSYSLTGSATITRSSSLAPTGTGRGPTRATAKLMQQQQSAVEESSPFEVMVHVPEPDSGISLEVQPIDDKHVFGGHTSYVDLAVHIQKPLFVPTDDAPGQKPPRKTTCRLVAPGPGGTTSSVETATLQPAPTLRNLSKQGSQSQSGQHGGSSEDVLGATQNSEVPSIMGISPGGGLASGGPVVRGVSIADQVDGTFVGRIVLGKVVHQSASISFNFRRQGSEFAPSIDGGSFGCCPPSTTSNAPPTTWSPGLNAPCTDDTFDYEESYMLEHATQGNTLITYNCANKLTNLSAPVAILGEFTQPDSNSNGATPTDLVPQTKSVVKPLVMKAARMPNGLMSFSIHLANESPEEKDALLQATTIKLRFPLFPQFMQEDSIFLSFCCSRERDTCVKTITAALPFEPAFKTEFQYRHFQGKVFCLARVTNNLSHIPIRLLKVDLIVLDRGQTYTVSTKGNWGKAGFNSTPLQPGGAMAIVFELSPHPEFVAASEVVSHSVRLVATYTHADQDLSKHPAKKKVHVDPSSTSSLSQHAKKPMQQMTFHERIQSCDYDAQLVQSEDDTDSGQPSPSFHRRTDTQTPSMVEENANLLSDLGKQPTAVPSDVSTLGTQLSTNSAVAEAEDSNTYFSPVSTFETMHSCPFSAMVLLEEDPNSSAATTPSRGISAHSRAATTRSWSAAEPITFHVVIEPHANNWGSELREESGDFILRVVADDSEWMVLGRSVRRVVLHKTKELRLSFRVIPLKDNASLKTPTITISRCCYELKSPTSQSPRWRDVDEDQQQPQPLSPSDRTATNSSSHLGGGHPADEIPLPVDVVLCRQTIPVHGPLRL